MQEKKSEITILRPQEDRSAALELLNRAEKPCPIEDWLGPKDSRQRRVGKDLLSLGMARRIKAPKAKRHLCQKFVLVTGVGRLFRDRIARGESAAVTSSERLIYAG